MKMKKNAMLSMFIMMIAALFVAGCGDDDDDTEMTNSQPIIDRVIVPESVKAGETVKLEVVAHDADGDKLTYNWEVSEGTVDAVGVWTVPSDATRATVLVRVGDGVNSAVTSSKISVEIVAPPDPSKPIGPQGMVSIPAGEFQMGSNDPEAENDEQPVHTVYVDAFFMDQHEVTNLEYQEFLLANPQWQTEKIDSKFHNGRILETLAWNGGEMTTPRGRRTTRLCMSVGMRRWHTRNGWGSDYPRRRSGSMPHAVGWWGKNIHGAMKLALFPIGPGASSLIPVGRTKVRIRQRWVSIRRTVTVCMT